MSLIKCEECGHMMSDAAQRCPKCGCPTSVHFMKIHYEGSSAFAVKGTIKLKVNGEEINHGGDFKNGLSTKVLLNESPVTVELSTFGNLRKVNFILSVDHTKNSQLELKYNTDIGFFTEAEYSVEGEEAVIIKASKGDKRRVYLFCSIILVLFIVVYVYVAYQKIQKSREEHGEYLNELMHSQKEQTENENTSSLEESDNTANSTVDLTEESIKDCFLRHWQHYKGDRELVSIEGCSEGYKVFIGDLNADGVDDALVNAYVTSSSEEIANGSMDNKSFIFCFLNDNGHCELAVATKLYAMFVVDNIDNGEIHAHRIECMKRMNDGGRVSVKDKHIFRYEGGQLIDLGGKKRVVDEEEISKTGQEFEKASLFEGWFYRYEGDMAGFPVKVEFCVLSDGVIDGEYQNVKYGTILKLAGRLNSDKTLNLIGENKKEKFVLKLSYSSPKYLYGYGINGGNSLKIKLRQVSNEVINDSN